MTLELAVENDKNQKIAFDKGNPGETFNLYDTLEDCVMEVEELKNELCTIMISRTGTGVNSRDRWDTPETKMPGGRKGRLRKDRYSSLVMANMIARRMHRTPPPVQYQVVGGDSRNMKSGAKGQMYVGPDWFTQGMQETIAIGVSHK